MRTRASHSSDHGETKAKFTPLVIALIGVLPLMLVFFTADDGFDETIIGICLAIFYGCFAITIMKPIEVRRGLPTFATPEVFFLILYFLVYYRPYQDELRGVGSLDRSQYFLTTYAEESTRSVLLATVGLLAFIGAVRCQFRPRNAPVGSEPAVVSPRSARTLLVIIMLGLVALIGINFGLGLRASGEGAYTDSAQGGLFAEAVSILMQILGMMAFAIFVHYSTQRMKKPWTLMIAVTLAAFWMLFILSLGNRNGFLMMGTVVVAGILTYRVRAGRVVLAALLIGALSLYSAVGALRNDGPVTAAGFLSNIASADAAPEESSFNVTTVGLRATLATVPQREEYGHGIYKLVGFLGVIPLVRGYALPDDLEHDTTASYLTSVITHPDASWEVGTNIVSDIYIDFGPWGVPALMALLGLAMAYARRRAQDRPGDFRFTVTYLLLLASLSQMPRYSFDLPVRALAWAWILMLLFRDRLPTGTHAGPDGMGGAIAGRARSNERNKPC